MVVGITFSIQPIVKWACDRLEGWWRIVVADIFLFFSFVGTINVWRGVWKLLDEYFLPGMYFDDKKIFFSTCKKKIAMAADKQTNCLPDNRILSDWITHSVSMILLILLNCSNSVLVRGVYIDAEEPAGQCVIFPVYYIRLFFQKERTKKQDRLLETLERQEKNKICLIEKPRANNVHAGIVTITTIATSIPMQHERASGETAEADTDTLLLTRGASTTTSNVVHNETDECKSQRHNDEDPIV